MHQHPLTHTSSHPALSTRPADTVKSSLTIAVSTALLAWSMIDFRGGYEKAEAMDHGLELIKYGADYLVKCHVGKTQFVAQVGGATRSASCSADGLLHSRRASGVSGV